MSERQTYQFKSKSNPNSSYTVILYKDGTTSCNCRGWIYSGAERGCSHTRQVEGGNPVSSKKPNTKKKKAPEIYTDEMPDILTVRRPMMMLPEESGRRTDILQGSVKDVEPMAAGVLKGEGLLYAWNNRNVVAEEKLDGARYVLHLLAAGNRLFSRNKSTVTGKRIERTDNVPHLRDMQHMMSGTILDGEIVTGDYCKSNDVTRIMNAHYETAAEVQKKNGYVTYKVFDILEYRGVDLRDKRYYDRYQILNDVVNQLGNMFVGLPRQTVIGKKDFYDKIIKEGGEGVILKHFDGKYVEGSRSPSVWAKVKREKNWNVICTGFTKGKKAFASTFGAMKFSMYDDRGLLRPIGKCSGMTLEMRNDISSNRDRYVGMVFEVTGQEMTEAGRIRHPRFKQWRPDVNPRTVTIKGESKSI